MNVKGTNSNTNNNAVAATSGKKETTLGEWMNSHKGAFLSAIPKGTVEIDRFMQSAVLAITNPKMKNLLNCSKESIFRSLKEAASYGLELNGTLGQAYLIPYNEKGVMTCHFQMGYKGLIALARRSSTIKTIAAEPVYENDIFDVQLGVGRTLSHKMDLMKPRGEIIGYYCLVELNNGGIQFKVVSKADIITHRDKFSKAYNKNDPENIWNKNFDAMALKTCVIQALKLCPISIEALDAVAKEEMEDVVMDKDDVTVVDYNENYTSEVISEIALDAASPKEEPAKETKSNKIENQTTVNQSVNQSVNKNVQNDFELENPGAPDYSDIPQMTPEEERQAEEAFDSYSGGIF